MISILTLNARLQNAWNVCAVSGLKGHNAAVRKKPVASISDCVAFTAFTITEMNPAISNVTHIAGVFTVIFDAGLRMCFRSGVVVALNESRGRRTRSHLTPWRDARRETRSGSPGQPDEQ